ncbi:MAG: LIC_13387 family protein [Burkholderiales bacterium]
MAPANTALAGWLVFAAALVILLLGVVHLLLTFRGDKLHPRDAALRTAMQDGHLHLTRETTLWRAWIGFNASHSLGAILFGLVFGYLALATPQLLFGSRFLLAVGAGTLGAYMMLGRQYWFSIPNRGILLALCLYALGLVLAFVDG